MKHLRSWKGEPPQLQEEELGLPENLLNSGFAFSKNSFFAFR